MARIVLISPPFMSDYMRNARCDFVSLSNSSWYPIWLGIAGSYLESKGHQTQLLDAQVMGLSQQQSLDEIKAFQPDLVAVYTGRLSEDSDISFADQLTELGLQVVFVGPYASINPSLLLNKSQQVKLAITREFDLPLLELAENNELNDIKNLLIKKSDGSIQENEIRPLYNTEILDTFPITSKYFHEQLDIHQYKTPSELYPYIDIISGRGCAWGKCNFCLWVHSFIPGSVYNLRSIGKVMAEFEYIRDFMPEVKSVMIQDDMLTNKRAKDISQALIDGNFNIKWSCYVKPNSKLKQETLHLMKRSGCLNLHVGFESGDDAVLEKIDKGSNVEQAIEFAEMAHKAKLQVHGDFAMGLMGETHESMQKTINLAKKINPHTAQFQIMIPFEGTRFMDQLNEVGALTDKGEPSYEKMGGPSSEEIRSQAKSAYRQFYISPAYFKKIVTQPREYFFNRFDQYVKAIPAVSWKRWTK